MATTLPRITPSGTPLPPAVTGLQRSQSSVSLYGPYPPPELSSSMDLVRIPARINPLSPMPPKRRINMSWETTDQHYANERRRLLMQKREYTRYHSAWEKPFYGGPAEKELYRKHFREVLKQQMSDQENLRRQHVKEKVKESERAVEYDRQCRMKDALEYFNKHAYLQKYRDGNKIMMEQHWANARNRKSEDERLDRERLHYNPINWSCTLK